MACRTRAATWYRTVGPLGVESRPSHLGVGPTSPPPTEICTMQHNFLMYRSRLCRLHDGLGHIIAKLSPHLGADNR
jgi:hypothetical protein